MKDRTIGGFIEFEFGKETSSYHTNAIALANGRECFHLFLNEYKPAKIYLPFYTCDTLIAPLILSRIPYEFYSIDSNFNPLFEKDLKAKEYVLYINYLDVKNETVHQMEKLYGSKLIVDNTQAFYNKQYKSAIASFNSCRKFFGVPDGGYLYVKKVIKKNFTKNENYTLSHLVSRLLGKTNEYYKLFVENELLMDSNIMGMSLLTETILNQTNYRYFQNKRIKNFNYLHKHLSKYNLFKVDLASVGTPYAYPFLPPKFIDRIKFYNNRLFISTLWMDVLNRKGTSYKTEKYLSANLLPLPIDQRYGEAEMWLIIKMLKPYL